MALKKWRQARRLFCLNFILLGLAISASAAGPSNSTRPAYRCAKVLLAPSFEDQIGQVAHYTTQRSYLYQILDQVVQGKVDPELAAAEIQARLALANQRGFLNRLSKWWVDIENIWRKLVEHQAWPHPGFIKRLQAAANQRFTRSPSLDWWNDAETLPPVALDLGQEANLARVIFLVYQAYLNLAKMDLDQLMPGQWELVKIDEGGPLRDEANIWAQLPQAPIYELQLRILGPSAQASASRFSWWRPGQELQHVQKLKKLAPVFWATWGRIMGKILARKSAAALAPREGAAANYPFVALIEHSKQHVQSILAGAGVAEVPFILVYGLTKEMRHLRDTGRITNFPYLEYATMEFNHRLHLPSDFFISHPLFGEISLEHELVHYQIADQKISFIKRPEGTLPITSDVDYGQGLNVSEVDAYLDSVLRLQNYLNQQGTTLSARQLAKFKRELTDRREMLQSILSQSLLHLMAIWQSLKNKSYAELMAKISLKAAEPEKQLYGPVPPQNAVNFYYNYPHPAQYFALDPAALPAEEVTAEFTFNQRPEIFQLVARPDGQLTPRDMFNGVQSIFGDHAWPDKVQAYYDPEYQSWAKTNLRDDLLRPLKETLLREFDEKVDAELVAYLDLYFNVFGESFTASAAVNPYLNDAQRALVEDYVAHQDDY